MDSSCERTNQIGTMMCWVQPECLNTQQQYAFWKSFLLQHLKRCVIRGQYHTCVQVTTWVSHIALISDWQSHLSYQMSGQPWHVWVSWVTNARLALSNNHKVLERVQWSCSATQAVFKLITFSRILKKNYFQCFKPSWPSPRFRKRRRAGGLFRVWSRVKVFNTRWQHKEAVIFVFSLCCMMFINAEIKAKFDSMSWTMNVSCVLHLKKEIIKTKSNANDTYQIKCQ